MQRRQSQSPRYPQQQSQHTTRENPRLRTHAVSLYHGDYSDDGADAWGNDDDDDDDYGFPAETEDAELSDWAKKEQEAYERQKQKWIVNSKPPERVSIIDERGRAYGRGGRKTSSARVWIEPGFGNVVVNRKDFMEYFPRAAHREHILAPFVATMTCGKFDIQCHVEGGGLSGQAGAIRHGLARALNHYNPDEYRPPLKRLGYLTRDPRKVERKKVGQKKARKSGQWSRR
jgi:small subunit ribosomal protein S9